jgi:hypothetical protein
LIDTEDIITEEDYEELVSDMQTYDSVVSEELNPVVVTVVAFPVFFIGIFIGFCSCCCILGFAKRFRGSEDPKATRSTFEMNSFQQDL